MVRKISAFIPEEQLQEDLEKFRQRSIELGATDAKIITTDMVVIDERVRAKCIYPKCPFYGTSVQCPPHAMDVDETRKIVKNFRYGIFMRLEARSEQFAGPEVLPKRLLNPPFLKLYDIITKVESQAFYDGYHLALGFGCGPCKLFYCPDQKCSALETGQPCRHPLRTRSSMEGTGMDVFTMAARVGWDVYPIGASLSPLEVPCGQTFGLVLVH